MRVLIKRYNSSGKKILSPSNTNESHYANSMCESLLNLIYVQRPYWKCFQYQGSFSVHEKTNGDTGERHIPTLSYLGNATKPLKYDTRNCYPVQSQEAKEKIGLQLARLKQGLRFCCLDLCDTFWYCYLGCDDESMQWRVARFKFFLLGYFPKRKIGRSL